jgi:alkylation response protein AidB-like acyl-CoA dehydrogenase
VPAQLPAGTTHLLAVADRTGAPWLALLPADRPGWTVAAGGDPAGDGSAVTVEDVELAAADLVVAPEKAAGVWAFATSRARLHQAAYLVGLARGAWAQTATHLRRRRQFDTALVDLPVLAQPMAALATRLEAARLQVAEAAWADDAGADTDRDLLSGQALALAAELALAVTRQGLHLHGARGLLLDAPIQGYYRRAAVEAARLGSLRALWQELGARRLAAEASADGRLR